MLHCNESIHRMWVIGNSLIFSRSYRLDS